MGCASSSPGTAARASAEQQEQGEQNAAPPGRPSLARQSNSQRRASLSGRFQAAGAAHEAEGGRAAAGWAAEGVSGGAGEK